MTIFENDLNTSNIAVDSNSNFQNICMIFIVQQLIYKNKIDLVYGGTHSANWILNQGVGETHSSKLKYPGSIPSWQSVFCHVLGQFCCTMT